MCGLKACELAVWSEKVTEEEIFILHVGMSRNLVVGLPLLIDGPGLPSLARIACIESFFVNIRGLIEFLRPGTHPKDFRATDYVPGFSAAEPNDFDQIWTLASQQVVHFSRNRGEVLQPEVTVETTRVGLEKSAAPVVAELDRFRDQLAVQEPNLAHLLDLPHV